MPARPHNLRALRTHLRIHRRALDDNLLRLLADFCIARTTLSPATAARNSTSKPENAAIPCAVISPHSWQRASSLSKCTE
eukprot:3726956-Prymnesium_polylepis.1